MRSAHISRRQAEATFDGLDMDEDVFAVQEDFEMRAEREEAARYVEEMERLLELERRQAHYRVPRFNDRIGAQRALRRSESTVLRALPVRLPVVDGFESEAA